MSAHIDTSGRSMRSAQISKFISSVYLIYIILSGPPPPVDAASVERLR